jgi:hypothetical protein
MTTIHLTEPPNDPTVATCESKPHRRPTGDYRVHRLIELSFVATFLLFASYQLFIPPVVGLADNGDFHRIMDPFGLAHRAESYQDRYFLYFQREYSIAPWMWSVPVHFSSADLLAAVTVAIATVTSKTGVFDIRLLGAANLALFAFGLWMLLRATRRLAFSVRSVTAVLLLVMFSDVSYMAPLNSMYMQPTSVALLMCSIGSIALAFDARRASWRQLVICTLFAMAFVLSKPQESIQAVPLAFCIALIARRSGMTLWRLALLIAILVLGGAVFYRFGTPVGLRRVAAYQAIYTEILAHSPTPVADLDYFGLPRWSAVYKGTDGFSPAGGYMDPRLDSAAFDRANHVRVGFFYLAHPARAFRTLERTASASFNMRPTLGNFEKDVASRYGRLSEAFDVWTSTKRRLIPYRWSAMIVFAFVWLCVMAWLIHRGGTVRMAGVLLLLVTLMAVMEFVVCSLLNAHYEIVRVLLTFHALIDLVIIATTTAMMTVSGELMALIRRRLLSNPIKEPHAIA